jgi:hypothetical protein
MRPCASIDRSDSSSARYPLRVSTASSADATPPDAATVVSAISARRSFNPPSALPVTPAAVACSIAAGNGMPAPLAYESIFATDVSPHTAARRVDDALPRHLVVGVHQRAQVRKRVLDLAPVVELHAAEHAVRDARAHERLFEHAALRVGAVEDRDVAEAMIAAVDEPLDLAHHERGFVTLVVALEADDRLALDLVGPECFGRCGRCSRSPRWRRRGSAASTGSSDRARPSPLRERLLELQQVPKVAPRKR